MNPSILVDIANFAIGFQHYVTERPIGTAGSNEALVRKGMEIFRNLNKKRLPELLENVGLFIRENNLGNLRTFFVSAQRGSPNDPERVVRVGTLFGRLLRRSVEKPAVLELIFGGDPESKRKARRLADAYSSSTSEGLKQQAVIPSKIIMIRTWVRSAARDIGVSPPPSEELRADVESAREIGRDLQSLQRSRDPQRMPEAKALAKKIKALAATSTDPDAILQAGFNPDTAKSSSLSDLWGSFLPPTV